MAFVKWLAEVPTGYHSNTCHLMSHLTSAKKSAAQALAISGARIAQPDESEAIEQRR